MNRDDLDTFYRATTFLVYHPGGPSVPLRVGQCHPDFDRLLPRTTETWAFLTACNPRSRVLSEAENAARMRSLVHDLLEEGYVFWPGSGISDTTDWKPEESLLVLGMARDEANALSERYDQNAFVYGERGSVAELVWTHETLQT